MPNFTKFNKEIFLKRRRNLIGITIIITLYFLAGIELNEINILGNKASIENPIVVSSILWVFFYYFLYRYWIYLKSNGSNTKVNNELKFYHIDIRIDVNKTVSPMLKKMAIKQNNEKYEKDYLIEVLETRIFDIHQFTGSHNRKNTLLSKAELSSLIKPDISNEEESYEGVQVTVRCYKAFFWPVYIYKTTKHIFINQSLSEYYLPYLLSIIPVIIFIKAIILFLYNYISKLSCLT